MLVIFPLEKLRNEVLLELQHRIHFFSEINAKYFEYSLDDSSDDVAEMASIAIEKHFLNQE